MLYSSTDEGDSWRQVALTAIGGDINAGIVAPSYVFADGSVVLFALDGTGFQYAQGDSHFESFRPVQLGNIRDVFTLTGLFLIDSMDFLDRQHGWALADDGGCLQPKSDCWQATFIEQTEDGGQSWTPLIMPGSTPTPFP